MLIAGIEGKVQSADPAARRWLRQFFGNATRSGKLPRKVLRWISRTSGRQRDRSLVARTATAELYLRGKPSYAQDKIILLFELIKDDHGRSRPHQTLTTREREVLLWLAGGNSNAEIGAILGIAPATVGKHLERIYPKLGVRNRTAASNFRFER
jgi:DNA-binding CsgD family transcriptional regulator